MSKKVKIIFLVIVLVMAVILGIYLIAKNNNQEDFQDNITDNPNIENGDNMSATMSAIVVKVAETHLEVMIGEEEENYLVIVNFSKEGNIGFKEGQEVLIYYNAAPEVNYPGEITDVEKIEIVKEKSNVTIPDEIKQIYQDSSNNIVEQ